MGYCDRINVILYMKSKHFQGDLTNVSFAEPILQINRGDLTEVSVKTTLRESLASLLFPGHRPASITVLMYRRTSKY